MQSNAKDVTSYLLEVPEDRREALSKLRKLCQEILVGYEECMDYGMPGYRKNGEEGDVGFASQKNYISLYILKKDVLDKFRPQLKGLSVGKGCIRYSKPEKIDFKIVDEMLRESYLSNGEIC
jgi:uncharacterized protein YdhG (YjbR/CyaY superfamily)